MKEKNDLHSDIKEFFYSINYIYYGLYFFVFASIQISHVLLVESSNLFSRWIYGVSAGLESFIEVLIMAFLSSWLLSRGMRVLHRIYILLTTALLFCRMIDFLLVRLMDISIWHGIEFIFQETLANFIELLYATNIQMSVWIGGGLGIVCIFLLGFLAFFLSEKICQKRPLLCLGKNLFGIAVLSSSVLILSELFLHLHQDPKEAPGYAKALPWKKTFLSYQPDLLTVGNYLKKVPEDSLLMGDADSNLFALQRKPDIFLFIVESLREDFLTQEVTPTLVDFKEKNTSFKEALSIANATHISWFSIFYSMYPFYWEKYQPNDWSKGSHSLSLLKKMGYQINVYSASRLSFYSMDKILFGKKGDVVDNLREFQSEESIAPYKADAMAIKQLCQDVTSGDQKGGRVFVVFLDSTHFDYSWPDEESSLFNPIEGKINYLKLSYTRDNISEIKNRYKNSLNYVDGLFSVFQKTLKEKGIWDDSVVVFTADHGEEFNEYGHMFHASTLSTPQIQVPLYVKLGSDKTSLVLNSTKKASQMDIFPTLLHYLTGENNAGAMLQGESLFTENPKPYVIGARYNAGRAPYQFYVQSGPYRMNLEFCNRHDIFHCNTLKINSIEDENEDLVPFTLSFIHAHFQKALDELFGSH